MLVAQHAAEHQHAALRGAVLLGDEAAAGTGKTVEERLFLLLPADPADFAKNAQQAVAIALVIVASNNHPLVTRVHEAALRLLRHAQGRLHQAHPAALRARRPRRAPANSAPCGRSA